MKETHMSQQACDVDSKHDVIIVGAGPVGLSLALALGRAGVLVLLLERESGLPQEGRATTIHASTLELLDEMGLAETAVAQGLPARTLQYRDHSSGEYATFDFGVLSPMTKFPFRLQLEQNQLCNLMLSALGEYRNVEIRFESEVVGVSQTEAYAEVRYLARNAERVARSSYLVGADGSRSVVRREAGIEFEGSTYPFTMLTLSTFVDIDRVIEDIAPVTYVFDSSRAMAFLRIKDHWRISLNTVAELPKNREELTDVIVDMASDGLGYQFNRNTDVKSVNIHRIHQRVAESFGTGRVYLAGDAAHLNSPTGGMGMNSGIHDACELFPALVQGLNEGHDTGLFESYKHNRKRVAIDVVGFASDQSTKDMIASADQRIRRIRELQQTATDAVASLEFLRGSTLLDDSPKRELLRAKAI